MGRIGAFISNLRKSKDLTQVELADKLNVSHQAVSKWERGESMPDIGTLPMLARGLDITVDQLLHGDIETYQNRNELQSFVEALGKEHSDAAGEMISSGRVTLGDLTGLAPILKPSKVRQMAQHISQARFTIDDVLSLAPFLDHDVVEEILHHTDANQWTWEQVCHIAPFINRSALSDWVEGMADFNAPTRQSLIRLAPFLQTLVLEESAQKVQEGYWNLDELVMLAPFVGRECLGILIQESLQSESPDMRHIKSLAPFVQQAVLEQMIAGRISMES